MCYHNHDFEFIKQDDNYPYDILLSADKDLVKMEMDIYWVTKAGMDPIDLFNKNPGRFPLLHLKDMADDPEQRFAPVGEGILKFGPILQTAAKLGVKWGIVEQDNCYDTPPIEALRTSFRNLQKISVA